MAAISNSAAVSSFATARLLPSLSPRLSSALHIPSPRLAATPVRLPRRPALLAVRASSTATAKARTVSVGDRLPDATLSYMDAGGEARTVTLSELTKGKKAVLFAVPGAFTPTCSQKHLPGFVEKSADLRAKGVETIACVSVNDAFVMNAWKKDLGIGEEVMLLSDGNMELTSALGVELDLSDKPVGLGMRSRRYALLAEDGVVKTLNLEEGGAFTISSADEILKAL